MKRRASQHIRGNIVGYVALFFALSASAYALPGTNTVDSGDIINGQVKSPDIGAGQVGRADLGTDSVNSAKVAANSLTGQDINELSLKGLVTGQARILNGSASVTSASNQLILTLPGWGNLKVVACSPSATPASRFAATAFASSGPSGTFWTTGGADGAVQSSFSPSTIAQFGESPGNAGANELLTVFLDRGESPQTITLHIAEFTNNTRCEFHAQALIAG